MRTEALTLAEFGVTAWLLATELRRFLGGLLRVRVCVNVLWDHRSEKRRRASEARSTYPPIFIFLDHPHICMCKEGGYLKSSSEEEVKELFRLSAATCVCVCVRVCVRACNVCIGSRGVIFSDMRIYIINASTTHHFWSYTSHFPPSFQFVQMGVQQRRKKRPWSECVQITANTLPIEWWHIKIVEFCHEIWGHVI